MNGGRLRCRNLISPSGGISVSGSTPLMWRAKPRATVIRRAHTEVAGPASGRWAHTSAASTVTVSAPIASR